MFALSEAYLALGELEKTQQLVTDAIKAEPTNVRGLYILGCIALKRRDYREAAIYLQRALQSGVSDARLPAARALLGMKDYNEAFTLANAIAAANNSAESQLLLGNAALALNDLKTAEPALKLAIKGNRDSAEGLALLSIVYQRRGDKVLADSYHKDAVKRDSKVFSTLLLPTQSALPEEKNAVPNAM